MAGLTSLARGLKSLVSQRTSDVLLVALKDTDDSPTGEVLRFQYFPETIQDSKQVNYQTKEIPGGSLPIYQWVSSGERLISFQAVFTTDVDMVTGGGDGPGNPVVSRLKGAGEAGRNVDIRGAVIWLRRFVLPRYGMNGDLGVPLTFAPRKIRMVIPGSGIGMAGGDSPAQSSLKDSVHCVMTQCEVTWEAFFPNGFPRIATVALAFAQVPQLAGNVFFPSATEALDTARQGLSTRTFGYTLEARGSNTSQTSAVVNASGQIVRINA